MRKLVAFVFCLLLILFLCGCSEKSELFTPGEIDSEVKIVCSDSEYRGQLTFREKEGLNFIFSYPSELSGVSISCFNNRLQIKYSDVEINSDFIADNSPVAEVANALAVLYEKPVTIPESGVAQIPVEAENGAYVYEIDCDRKKVCEISNEKINAIFIN